MNKDRTISAINKFPQEFELDDLLEELIITEKVENGLKQLEQGKTVPHEIVKEVVKKW